MVFKRCLPTDVERDIHDIVAKAMFLRVTCNAGGQVRLTPEEIKEAAEAQFEFDLQDDGSLIFRMVDPADDVIPGERASDRHRINGGLGVVWMLIAFQGWVFGIAMVLGG